MSFLDVTIFTLKFYVPAVFTMLFRVCVFGRKSKQRVAVGLTVYTLYMLLVPAALIELIGYGQYTHIVFYVMTLGSFSVLIFSADPPVKTMFLQFVMAIALSSTSTVLNMLRHLTGSSYLTLLVATAVCNMLSFIVALRFFAKPLRFIQDNLHVDIPTLLTPFLVMVIGVWISTYPPRNFESHPVFCTMITLMVQTAFFLYLYTLYKNLRTIRSLTQKEKQQEILQLSLDDAKKRLILMDEAVGQMSATQHDQRHLNATLLELLQSGDTGKAAALITQQTAALPQRPARYCENITINAAVSYYAALAEQRGIHCDLRLDIPEALPCSELGLSMVLSNLMENAIHACETLEAEQERRFLVQAVYTGQLILEVQNPYTGEVIFHESGYPVTHEEGHGGGTKSVRAFVEETGSEIIYTAKNGIFNVRLLI